jgi:hypothetical protein
MKKITLIALFGLLFLTTTAFSLHKFYMAVYQINYAPQKKMLQITSRIFIDDLNSALEKKYNRKLHLEDEKEIPEESILLKKYLAEHFSLKVNGQSKTMNFLSKELDGDVLICYWNIKDIKQIKALEIYNSVMTDWNSEQQNIIHISILGKKNSLLFKDSSTNNMLKY